MVRRSDRCTKLGGDRPLQGEDLGEGRRAEGVAEDLDVDLAGTRERTGGNAFSIARP